MTSCQMTSVNEVLVALNHPPLDKDIQLTGLTLDSRRLIGGELFLAVPGFSSDGREFIKTAVASGAAAVLAESVETSAFETETLSGKPIIFIKDLKARISFLADQFYRQPSSKLKLTGVTGTNGKTSTCWFAAQLLSLLDEPCAVMGTLGKGVPPELEPCLNTTSDSVSTQSFMAELVGSQVHSMAMEVSSHGLHQGRADGLQFEVGVFTNISRDHLDYHQTMDAYAEAKALLFVGGRVKKAVINLDDEYSGLMLSRCSEETETFTFSMVSAQADIFANNITLDSEGVKSDLITPWGEGQLKTPQFGRFSLENLLAVIGAVCCQGFSLEQVLEQLPQLIPVPGRMQRLGGGQKPVVVVDYAHTSDALVSVLTALREHGASKLICVFGCGGDRDRGKRPLMARAAVQGADEVVVTSDNPRSEDPSEIIRDALAGVEQSDTPVTSVINRAEAIQLAICKAGAGDIVVIAGKGHEDYQEINGIRHSFDDCEEAIKALDLWKPSTASYTEEGL
ncbi:UDP-N-acetylmuramoyl-L-alanyl-D-glutamate--2,6-diaminopimelate ligase [Endozoicomonas numazuensis]|uniref:UDP-N-acetylmuramoyl-L-alanyl-D-glutamate--2, 6-diaminopimelate ligase n=1 Tax=Endozoicomonas numazuensis TaxID=1137799 RepID=UPI000ADF83C8|nr:UDP-N-acetylmuramoyl-L-alanyl-D-glutamate--2,6-diaminopimelate ligase [Endozoicomonas numazuensis]